ncbi:MAG: discoidin domain-containing protein [Spirochaetales bacterium]|nr:discoidin domain-containing protein [Spirochaetales bacterium]
MIKTKSHAHKVIFLLCGLLAVCMVTGFILGCDIPGDPSDNNPLDDDSGDNEWVEFRDDRFGYGVMVPSEWEIKEAPDAGHLSTTSIMNYDSEQIVQTGISDVEWPEETLKVDIIVIENIETGTPFDQAIRDNLLDLPYILTDVLPDSEYGLSGAMAIRFVNSNNPSDSIRSLGTWLGPDKIMTLFLYPETAWQRPAVKEIIGSMSFSPDTKTRRPQVLPFPAIDKSAFNPVMRKLRQKASISRDPGDEVGDSPINPLYMPFTEGTSWIVGGAGSYYGEGAHLNIYNDYYAVDWNKGANGVYEYDYGETIYPVAPGRVIAVRYDKENIFGGYGNYVKIQHDMGVTTLYGHLSAVFVGRDQEVTINTPIGLLGSTGNSTGPHLHLSFRINGISQFATEPSRRPSPVLTTAGLWKLRDGGFAIVSKAGTSETPGPTSPPPVSCASCIIGNRPDILPFYAANGWNTDPSNWDAIIANWCSIDAAGCTAEKARCSSLCGDVPTPVPTETPGPTATGAAGLSCSECIIHNRPDILPFYAANGWDTGRGNWDNIIANWCGIDAAGCAAEKAACGTSCDNPATPAPTNTPVPGNCAECVFEHRPDILPFYQSNGWNINPSNWDAILANWCGIDPVGCAAEKARCGSVCGVVPTPPPGSNTCAECVFSIRPDILPFYESNGWNIAPSNWDAILANWCGIDPAGCETAKAQCGAACNVTPAPTVSPAAQTCAECVFAHRPDILPFYESNGWNINPSNWDAILANWCGIDPAGCETAKAQCGTRCSGSTGTAINYAYGAMACTTDSSYDSNFTGNRARDGNTGTKWCSSNSSSTHWIKYDLGSVRRIERIVVRHAGSNGEMRTMNTESFEIRFGRYDNTWAQSVSVINHNQDDITDINVGPFESRYVMLYIIDAGIDNYARIYEFEVWNLSGANTPAPTATPVPQATANLAFDAVSITTDTNFSGDFTGSNAGDGNGVTKWCSLNTTSSHWLKYDLGGVRTITRIVVRHAGSNGEMQAMNSRVFEIRFGQSDNVWNVTEPAANYAQNDVTDITVGPYEARYVMLHITDCGIDNYARIYEFEVWGTGGSGATAPPPVSTATPAATPQPTTTPPPAPDSLKGAYWLQFDGGYDSIPAHIPKVAWNFDYAVMIPNLVDGYRNYYLPNGIKSLIRINLDLTPEDKAALENYSNPATRIAGRIAHWNDQVNLTANSLGGNFDALVYAFIFGNEENLQNESGISGTAYARAYNAFRDQWNGRGKLLLAAGPGGCNGIGSCTLFYDRLLAAINTVDGFAIHAYGWESFSHWPDTGGFIEQIDVINRAKGRLPIFITEYNIPPGAEFPKPQNGLEWGRYFNDRYNDVLAFNATHGNQIKALMYFIDSHDHWPERRFGSNTTPVSEDWWNYSLRKGAVNGDGRRDAWKSAPYAPQ